MNDVRVYFKKGKQHLVTALEFSEYSAIKLEDINQFLD